MSTQRASKYVKCPFFHYYNDNKIVCEGIQKGSTTQLVYKSPRKRVKYFQEVCCDLLSSRDCPVYLMLMEKYEET